MSDRAAARHLAAVLSMDVVGYSRLMGLDEEVTLDALRTIGGEVAAEVEAALTSAKASPWPDPATVTDGVWA